MIDQLPYEPPDPETLARLIKLRKRAVRERNRRDHEYEEKAAERAWERLWDWSGQ